MATRRAHNKSRLGCHQCKRRRIKCDVKQPSCKNCDKKSLDCSFQLLAPTSRLSIVPATSPKPSRTHNLSPSSTLEAKTTPTYTSSLQSASPGREIPLIPLTPSPRQVTISDDEMTYQLEDFSLAPLESLPSSSIVFSDVLEYTSKDPSQSVASSLSIPPSLPVPTSWSPILQSLPTSLCALLSHYEYTTTLTLHPSDSAKAAWITHMPGLANNHAYLLNCVLSVASLHLGRLHDRNSPQRIEMNALAASRMNKALSTYTTELSNVTKDNAAALFASATLTAVYLFRTTKMDMDELRSSLRQDKAAAPPDEIVQKMFKCALRPIWGLRGPLTVLMSGWMWVWSGNMQSVAARSWWPTHIVPATLQAVTENERLSVLKDSWPSDDGTGDLAQALEYLRESFALVSQLTLPNTYPPVTSIPYSIDSSNTTCTLTDRGAIFVWATQVSRTFMQRIEAQDPHALVLLAHYAILPGRVRNVWWLEGLGADIVTAIALVLGEEGRSLIEWPATMVGVDLGDLGSERKDRLEGRPEEMGMDVI
ncbi:hypothetical protein BDU57DRAFT_560192 [Ampelomyces quisqualis]|uniref:Zn(2)-C6 fungal-type domain-containing protein n=1 Tax=Ampelomyces quisqualis TaxID=50730 RepID=A0A6A5QAF7_AMPQU|nr:hypothetical protein BDU57DRAFT_560192 [Ampelomyces quisqualis]